VQGTLIYQAQQGSKESEEAHHDDRFTVLTAPDVMAEVTIVKVLGTQQTGDGTTKSDLV